jgi:hypothetical protein
VYEYVCIKLRTTFLSRSVLKSVRSASCDAMKFRTSMLVRIQTRVYLQPSSQSLSRSVLYREGHHTFRVQSLIHFHLRKMMLVCAPQHQTHCSVGPFCILGHHTFRVQSLSHFTKDDAGVYKYASKARHILKSVNLKSVRSVSWGPSHLPCSISHPLHLRKMMLVCVRPYAAAPNTFFSRSFPVR